MDVFVLGFVIGVIGMVVTVFIVNIIQGWINTRNTFYQPQKVIHSTDLTPADVYRRSKVADSSLTLFKMLLFSAGWIFFEVYFPDTASSIHTYLVEILRIFIRIFLITLQLLDSLLNK